MDKEIGSDIQVKQDNFKGAVEQSTIFVNRV